MAPSKHNQDEEEWEYFDSFYNTSTGIYKDMFTSPCSRSEFIDARNALRKTKYPNDDDWSFDTMMREFVRDILLALREQPVHGLAFPPAPQRYLDDVRNIIKNYYNKDVTVTAWNPPNLNRRQ
jgi:hypothetical protein